MPQSIKEELLQTLDRLTREELLAVLHFARHIERQATELVAASARVGNAEAARALTDFIAAAGSGQSGDPNSALRVDEILYGHQETP